MKPIPFTVLLRWLARGRWRLHPCGTGYCCCAGGTTPAYQSFWAKTPEAALRLAYREAK